MIKIKDHWQFISLFVLILFTLMAQAVSYGSLKERVNNDQIAIERLTNNIEKLTNELSETNMELGLIRGYIEAKREYNGLNASR
jgi:hypothetical protein